MKTKLTPTQKIRLVVIAVACLAMFRISFSHIVDVATVNGNADTALWFPIGIDGSIIATAMTLAAKRGVNKATKQWGLFVRWTGFAFTIFANVAHSDFISAQAVIINLAPALGLIGLLEMLIHAAQGTPVNQPRARKATPRVKPNTAPVKLRRVA